MEKLLCPSMMCADYGRLAEEIKQTLREHIAPLFRHIASLPPEPAGSAGPTATC